VKVKAKDETEAFSTVKAECETEELKEPVIDDQTSITSREVSISQSVSQRVR
jgi:hypothetical protein